MTTPKKALVSALRKCDATHALALPRLGITWMIDEFYQVRDRFRLMLTRSEQTASVMAQVYGKLTGTPGVFMGQGLLASTTGAGAILEAHFAGSPMGVLPGMGMTERTRSRGLQRRTSEERDRVLLAITLRRHCEADDVAASVAFLVSNDAAFLTGVTLDLNGGQTMA